MIKVKISGRSITTALDVEKWHGDDFWCLQPPLLSFYGNRHIRMPCSTNLTLLSLLLLSSVTPRFVRVLHEKALIRTNERANSKGKQSRTGTQRHLVSLTSWQFWKPTFDRKKFKRIWNATANITCMYCGIMSYSIDLHPQFLYSQPPLQELACGTTIWFYISDNPRILQNVTIRKQRWSFSFQIIRRMTVCHMKLLQ